MFALQLHPAVMRVLRVHGSHRRHAADQAGVAADRVQCERATYTFRHPGPPDSFLAVFRDYYGPTMNAFAAAKDDGREAQLQSELSALFESQNRGDAGRTEIPATFLKVTVAV